MSCLKNKTLFTPVSCRHVLNADLCFFVITAIYGAGRAWSPQGGPERGRKLMFTFLSKIFLCIFIFRMYVW